MKGIWEGNAHHILQILGLGGFSQKLSLPALFFSIGDPPQDIVFGHLPIEVHSENQP